MSWQSIVQALVMVVALCVTVPPLGRYIAVVHGSRGDGTAPLDRLFLPVERFIYRVRGVDERARAALERLRPVDAGVQPAVGARAVPDAAPAGWLPFNPTEPTARWRRSAPSTSPSASSPTPTGSGTRGELTMSHLTQMLGLTVQNFVSAAVGMAVVVAIIRGIARTGARTLGNFWVDLTRTITRILLPMCARVRRRARLAGRDPELQGRRHRHHDRPDHRDLDPVDPRRTGGVAGSRSSSSAPTAAASSTPTRPTRSRARTRSPTSSRTARMLLIPFAFVVTFG